MPPTGRRVGGRPAQIVQQRRPSRGANSYFVARAKTNIEMGTNGSMVFRDQIPGRKTARRPYGHPRPIRLA